ncbi:MAG: histone deacetylase [Actinocrinis sp.]
MYFALESKAWTGGMSFYDPTSDGSTAARAYLITLGQFSDIAAQEMYQEPGKDFDLSAVFSSGRVELGAGRYETLIYSGELDGHPVLTFTAPWSIRDVAKSKPTAQYLAYLASGLKESHGWSAREVAEYLVACPGAKETWTVGEIERMLMK